MGYNPRQRDYQGRGFPGKTCGGVVYSWVDSIFSNFRQEGWKRVVEDPVLSRIAILRGHQVDMLDLGSLGGRWSIGALGNRMLPETLHSVYDGKA
jgi:hypothetical protein